MPVEGDVRVGEVVDDENLPLAREVDDPLHEVAVDDRGRRVVRERENEHPWARPRALECLHDVPEQVSAPDAIAAASIEAPAKTGAKR